jgi:hypothetical protein
VTQSNSLVLGSISGVNGCGTFDGPCGDTKVGIGTTAPAYKLHVIEPGFNGLRVETDTGFGTVASFGGLGDFQIDASGVPGGRFTVREDGTVGIGTNTPQAKLQVQGGNIYVGTPGQGVILKSPNGVTCRLLTIDNMGNFALLTVSPCP